MIIYPKILHVESVTSKRVCIGKINDIQTCLLNHSRKTIIYRWICIALCSIISMYELFFIKEMEEFALKKLMISRRVCSIIQGKKIIYRRICIALCSIIGTYELFFIKETEAINLTYQEHFIFHNSCVTCLNELIKHMV